MRLSKRKFSTASSTRPVPHTTPYRRPSGSRRVNTSNTERRWAAPLRSAACSIVSSYRSVNSAVEGTMTGSPRSAVLMSEDATPNSRQSDDFSGAGFPAGTVW